MSLVYIDEICAQRNNNKEELIQWLIDCIDEEDDNEIDEKVVDYLLNINNEKIIKLDNYVRKDLQNGSKDNNPCCRENYGDSIDCKPYCLGCKDSIARLRKYFHLVLNLKIQCEKLVVLIKTKNLTHEQQEECINKLLVMCKEFLPIEQSGKILEMVLKQSTELDVEKLIEKFIKEQKLNVM
jgi:hypothetical protein